MLDCMLCFGVSIFASIIGAISGIGGGVIIKPALEAASSLPSKSISFLSGCTVLVMALISVLLGRTQKAEFEYRRSTMLGIGAAFGGVCGNFMIKLIAGRMSDVILGRIQAAMLCGMILLILAYCIAESKLSRKNTQSTSACMGLGFSMGIVSSFLGIGGGPLNLAILRYCFQMDNRKAALHSLYVIVFSQTASLLVTLFSERIPISLFPLLLSTIIGGSAGGVIGRMFSKKIGDRTINILYICVLIFVFFISFGNLI